MGFILPVNGEKTNKNNVINNNEQKCTFYGDRQIQ